MSARTLILHLNKSNYFKILLALDMKHVNDVDLDDGVKIFDISTIGLTISEQMR